MELSRDTVERLEDFAKAESMYGEKIVQPYAKRLADSLTEDLEDAGERF